MAHRTVARTAEHEEIVRGSRFIGQARPLSSPEELEDWLTGIRAMHSGASHHCWAFRIGSEMRFSDDGEPGGTAGRPILEVVLKRDLDRVGLVVVRYFGGTKLGAGGLVRAYGGTAAKALDLAGEVFVEDRHSLTLHIPFALVDTVHRLLADTRGVRTLDEGFDAHGWCVTVELPQQESDPFRVRLADITRGAATVEE